MQTYIAPPKWLHRHHHNQRTKGILDISIAMIPLPPFEKFRATVDMRMRFNGEYLEIRALVDRYFHLAFWIYIHTSDLYDQTTLPIAPDGLPGTAYAGFFADQLYDSTHGQLIYSYNEATEEFKGSLHFDAWPYRFTDGEFRIKGLNPPIG